MPKVIKKFPKKIYLLLGFFWLVALFFVMLMQNQFISPSEDLTVKTFATVQKKTAANEPITPLPVTLDVNLEKVALGFRLFNDPQLSANGMFSCASCHNLEQGGGDNLPISFGMNGEKLRRNSPTVFNSSFNYRQFWDGRAATLEEQVDGPLQNEKEMASSWDVVIKKLNASPDYPALFERVYNKKDISPVEVREAIAEFERALVTPNSPFDLWLNGHEYGLNASQKNGYKLFKSYGCISCHHGINVGGSMFEKIGVFNEFYNTHPSEDKGRFEITGDENAIHEFKVPSLRNVALTKPYMHDGSIKTLHEAIEFMAHYQLGIKLTESEISDIEAFLNSLTGDKPSVLK